MVVFACSSIEPASVGETHPGLSCGTTLDNCDIYAAGCRQDVLDVVACLRGYETQVRQPEVTFIELDDLLAGAVAPSDSRDEQDIREGHALFDLIDAREVSSEAAFAAQADSIAALYSASNDQIYILENPGGVGLSEAELGISVDAYRMSVLAHEYVHFLQDIESDLDEFSSRLPEEFDAALAGISAVEGEAVLYEGLFQLEASGRRIADGEVIDLFEQYIDFAEREIREVESPALEARYLFPYTYGAHSAALVHFGGNAQQLEQLRYSHSTLEYIQRRWGIAERRETPAPFEPPAREGIEQVNSDQLGPWLLNAFWSRVLNASTPDALAVAQLWGVDRMRVWRTSVPDEIVAQWIIEFRDPASDSGAEESETSQRVLEWRDRLQNQPSTLAETWFVRAQGPFLEVTSSNVPESAAARDLANRSLAEVSPTSDASEGDSGVPAESENNGETTPASTDLGRDAGVDDQQYAWQSQPLTTRIQRHAMGEYLHLPKPRTLAQRERVRLRLRNLVEGGD